MYSRDEQATWMKVNIDLSRSFAIYDERHQELHRAWMREEGAREEVERKTRIAQNAEDERRLRESIARRKG